MPALSELFSLIPGIPLTHLMGFLGICALGLAAYTVHAVVTLAKGRDK